LRTRPGIRRR